MPETLPLPPTNEYLPQPQLTRYYPPYGSGRINRFSDERIQAAIDNALSALPAGTAGALVAYGKIGEEGAAVAVAARLGSHWSIAVGAAKQHDQPLEAEAVTVFSW